MTKRIAIIGGGIAGVTAAWQAAQLARSGAPIEATLFESSPRLGGIVETVRENGFIVECGPDGWVTEKPWARLLAIELGLEDELLPSNDAARKTHILLGDRLETMPDGMRMMVPSDLAAVDASHLFSAGAKQAFHDELSRSAELRHAAPLEDESIASFTRRHFGQEVLTRIAVPLLSGVLGGDVEQLSVQAVMPQFVAMERAHGSLVAALQARGSREAAPIFTTLRSGLGTLIDRLVAQTPSSWLRTGSHITSIERLAGGWRVQAATHPPVNAPPDLFDEVFVAVPPRAAAALLQPLDTRLSGLLEIQASSAIIVAFAFPDASALPLPQGFGFLVPPGSQNQLLACTFADQKFDRRVPPGARLVRAFFGGASAEALLPLADADLADLALRELASILGPLPAPDFRIVRRWPRSLPQYAVGHLRRMDELDDVVRQHRGLTLLGNAYRGVGLPDLIRDARAAVRKVGSQTAV